MRLGVLVDAQRFEVLELIEPEERILPRARVVDLALLQQQFAPNDFVAGDGVAGNSMRET